MGGGKQRVGIIYCKTTPDRGLFWCPLRLERAMRFNVRERGVVGGEERGVGVIPGF